MQNFFSPSLRSKRNATTFKRLNKHVNGDDDDAMH